MSRRIITKSTIEEIVQSGQKSCPLGPKDIVTALAKDYARDVGVSLVRGEVKAAGVARTAAQQSGREPPKSFDVEDVRKAVVSVLGQEPEGLRAIIEKIMKD